MSIVLTANQKKQLQAISSKVDLELENDRRFFDRHSHRTCYVRRAYPSEQENVEICGGEACEPGDVLYVVVRQFFVGGRVRAFLRSPSGIDTDISDDAARELWTALAAKMPALQSTERLMVKEAVRRQEKHS